jgi:hypothetical protein
MGGEGDLDIPVVEHEMQISAEDVAALVILKIV